MGKTQFQQKISPSHLNLDEDLRGVQNGGVRSILNGRRGTSNNSSIHTWENIRSTLQVPYELPNGENICIGSFEDIKNNRVIYFNWNEFGYHGIYCYIASENIIVPVYLENPLQAIVLNFDRYHTIKGTKMALVDGKHLFWTDKFKAPRYINLDWAIDYKKKKKWELQLFDLTRTTNNDIFSVIYKGNGVSVFDLANGITLLEANSALNNYFDIEQCEGTITFTEKEWGTCELRLKNLLQESTERLVPQNFYETPHNERQIDMVLYPPNTAPDVSLKIDKKNKRNFLSGNTWQFRVRYKYKELGYSTWSPWSKMLSTANPCYKEYNYIEVDYSSKIFQEFQNMPEFELLEAVEIGYRNTNNGELYRCATIMQKDIPNQRKISPLSATTYIYEYKKQLYNFYNDIHADVRPQEEDVKYYDNVPLRSGVLGLIRDRIVQGDIVEDYDVDCFDFDCKVEYHNKEQRKGVTITIPVRIKSTYWATHRQCIWQTDGASYPIFGGYKEGDGGNTDENLSEGFGQQIPLGGFLAYIAGTDMFAISKQPEYAGYQWYNAEKHVLSTTNLQNVLDNNDVLSYATFENVPDGTHIIRLASHWCSAGDVLGKGSKYYDYTSGLDYQKTSTNVYSVGNQTNKRELQITVLNGQILGYQNYTYQNMLDNFTFTVEDCTDNTGAGASVGNSGVALIQAYVVDGASPNQSDLASGNLVEFAEVKHEQIDSVRNSFKPENRCGHINFSAYSYTDHNGYTYKKVRTREAIKTYYSFNANKLRAGGVRLNYLNCPQNFYDGNLNTIYLGAAGTSQNADKEISEMSCYNMVFPRRNGSSKYVSTYLKGKVLTADGYPLANARINVTGTSRFEYTDQNGDFSILVHTDSGYNSRVGTLIISGTECFSYSKKIEFNIPIDENNYNTVKHYNFGEIRTSFIFPNIKQEFYIKSGGVVDFGVSIADRANRMTSVIFDENKHRLKFPFLTEYVKDYFPNITQDSSGNAITATTKADGFFTVTIEPKSTPPIWATHMYINRTEDQVYADWVQMIVSDVLYVENYGENTVDGITTPDPVTSITRTSGTNEIYLDLTTSFIEYKNRNSDSKKGWLFEAGDRIRFIYYSNGATRNFIEVQIKEQRGNYFVIDNIEMLGNIEKGEVVEVFRLKTKKEKQLFYEIGEYSIVRSPYGEFRYWDSNSVKLNTGDSYRRFRKMYTKDTYATRLIEDPYPADTYDGKDNDIGRANFVDITYKQINKNSALRFGGRYLKGSNINNLHSYNALDILDDNGVFGSITAIDDFNSIMFVAQKHRCHIRYVNQTIAMQGDQQIALDSSRFLSDPSPLDYDGGCSNPESYSRNKNSAKFIDAYRGCMNQYSVQNGVINISGYSRYNTTKFVEKYFTTLSQSINNIHNEVSEKIVFINGGYSFKYKEYYVSPEGLNILAGTNYGFLNAKAAGANIGDNDDQFKKYDNIIQDVNVLIEPDTMTYDDTINLWVGRRGYVPECYSILTDRYIGFKDGQLYFMEEGIDYMDFFGVPQKQSLTVIVNNNPSEIKDFLCWSIEGTHKWSNPSNVIPYSPVLGRTQVSRTPDPKILGYNRTWQAAFLKDENTPNFANPLLNGSDMVGEVMLVTLENEHRVPVQLYCVNVYSQYVPRSGF